MDCEVGCEEERVPGELVVSTSSGTGSWSYSSKRTRRFGSRSYTASRETKTFGMEFCWSDFFLFLTRHCNLVCLNLRCFAHGI